MGTRILSVEDDERIRTAVKLALEDEGWSVEEADTGEEALSHGPCSLLHRLHAHSTSHHRHTR